LQVGLRSQLPEEESEGQSDKEVAPDHKNLEVLKFGFAFGFILI
jgi:hypothetical protein